MPVLFFSVISFALYSTVLMAPFHFLFSGPSNKQYLGVVSGFFGIGLRYICFSSLALTLFFPHHICSVFCIADIKMSVHLKIGGNNSRLQL